MANDGKNTKGSGQLSMPLVIKGGRDGGILRNSESGRVIYRSTEFYSLRDKLVQTLPDKKKPKS